jgi:type IV secretory pathway protease TraF
MLRLVWHAGRVAAGWTGELTLRAAVALGAAGYGEPPRPDRLRKACVVVVPTALVTSWAIPQLTWVVSPSIEAWAVRPAPGPIRSGDYVSFWLSDPLAGPRPVHVTKHALCLAGQMLNEVDRHPPSARDRIVAAYYCDGRLLGVSKAFSAKGVPLDHFAWGRRPVPPGFAYVGSHHPDGYDSRYYGPVAIDRLTRMERVL